MMCAACRDNPGHPAEACEDAQHQREYPSCTCQHRPPMSDTHESHAQHAE